MSDPIDRQQAIDAMCDFFGNNDGTWSAEKITILMDVGIIIANLPAQQEPQWIPCSERLPEDGKWCLFTDGVTMSVERYKADALDHFFPQGRWFSLEDAVAWMPLPEPYKSEQDKEEKE